MCGIYGFSELTPITSHMAGVLSVYMNERGRSAHGLTDGDTIQKDIGSILDKYKYPSFAEGSSLLVHTRAPSVGANTQPNAHPFEWLSGTRRIIGCHNGHIANWSALKTKYSATRHATEVDSQQIFAALAENTPLAELDGWGTICWYEMLRDDPDSRKLYISTFSKADLAIAKLTSGEIVFASTAEAIVRAIAFSPSTSLDYFYSITPKIKYEIIGNDLFVGEKLPWGDKPLAYQTHSSSFSPGPYSRPAICLRPGCAEVIKTPEKMIVCHKCFEKYLADYIEYSFAEEESATWKS